MKDELRTKFLRNNTNLLVQVIDNISVGVYIVDINKKLVYWSKGAENITGFSSSDVINSRCSDDILMHTDLHGKSLCRFTCPLHLSIMEEKEKKDFVLCYHKHGYRIPVEVNIFPLYDENGLVVGATEIFYRKNFDYSEAYSYDHLYELSFIDELTMHANQRAIKQFLSQLLSPNVKTEHYYALGLIRIQDIEAVIQKYGYNTTQDAIINLSKTINTLVSTSDFIGRWDNNVFVIIFEKFDLMGIQNLLKKINETINTSITFEATIDNYIDITIRSSILTFRTENALDSVISRLRDLLYIDEKPSNDKIELFTL